MSIRIYVGGLPEAVTREEVQEVFQGVAEASTLKLITDRKTGKCRGFGFLTIATEDVATSFIEQYNNHAFQEGSLRIERAEPKAAPGKEDAPPRAIADETPNEVRKPSRPVKAAAPVRRIEKPAPVTAEATEATAADTTELTAIPTSEVVTKPTIRPSPPTRRAATPTVTPTAAVARTAETAVRRETSRGRRTSTNTNTRQTEGRRPAAAATGGISYRDLEEAGAIDPRWAGLLEAKKRLELTV
jgi:RNA recognition motif-containing protein